MEIVFEYEYENPQDISSELECAPGRLIRVEEFGRRIALLPMVSGEETLQVGQSRAYLLPVESLAAMAGVRAMTFVGLGSFIGPLSRNDTRPSAM